MENKPLLQVKNLRKYFEVSSSFFGKEKKMLTAVDGLSFEIYKGETFGLVGESGCGKSTTGRTIINLYNPTDGEIVFNGRTISAGLLSINKELAKLKEELKVVSDSFEKDQLQQRINELKNKVTEIKKLNKSKSKEDYKSIQMIFQDPYASLNSRMTVTDIIAEGIDTHNIFNGDKEAKQQRIYELLEVVGLKREHASRYPHEFSGGQRQRIGIARALAIEPELIICDEPISALDVSIQAQVVNMLEDLQNELGLTYLFIAHDLSMVKHISDRIGVMYLGVMMEIAASDELYANPLHPYTKALLSSIPVPNPDSSKDHRIRLEGDVPSPINPKPGCRFASRCIYCEERCKTETPEFREVKRGHFLACHFVEKINNL